VDVRKRREDGAEELVASKGGSGEKLVGTGSSGCKGLRNLEDRAGERSTWEMRVERTCWAGETRRGSLSAIVWPGESQLRWRKEVVSMMGEAEVVLN
jgi:hypothetical protein